MSDRSGNAACDRAGEVESRAPMARVGIDLLEIERLERALERRPGLRGMNWVSTPSLRRKCRMKLPT